MFSFLCEKFLETEMSIVEEANEKEEEKILLWKMMKGICCILMSYFVLFSKEIWKSILGTLLNLKEIPRIILLINSSFVER